MEQIIGTYCKLQWNPSITDIFGEQCFGLYTEVAFVERLFCSFGTWVPGRYIAAGLYSEVVVNRGSTVIDSNPYALMTLLQALLEYLALI